MIVPDGQVPIEPQNGAPSALGTEGRAVLTGAGGGRLIPRLSERLEARASEAR